MAKEKSSTSLTSVYEGNIKPAQSNPNLCTVRTELPADLAKDSKYPTGFIAVPKFDVHQPKESKFASVELHDVDKQVNIQYTDKAGNRQVAQVAANDLIAAHAEHMQEYRAQRAAEMEAKGAEAPAPEKAAEPEM